MNIKHQYEQYLLNINKMDNKLISIVDTINDTKQFDLYYTDTNVVIQLKIVGEHFFVLFMNDKRQYLNIIADIKISDHDNLTDINIMADKIDSRDHVKIIR
jgi:hypothetical protein